jgi:hypothetical protein
MTWRYGSFKLQAQTTVQRGEIKTMTLPDNLIVFYTGLANSGVRVTASDDIVVYSINSILYSADAFTVFPVKVLGTEYYTANAPINSATLIVATQDNTEVKFECAESVLYSGTRPKGTTITQAMSKYQTMYVFSSIKDFSGSHVTANKPIAVFSGSERTHIHYTSSTDHIVEQLLPVASWGKSFALTSTPVRQVGDIFRVIGSKSSTSLTLLPSTNLGTIGAGSFKDIDIATGDHKVLQASEPVQVVVYSKTWKETGGDSPEGGDPFIAVIPPVEQYANQYFFSTVGLAYTTFIHSLSITIQKSLLGGLRLDGAPLPTSVTWNDLPALNLTTAAVTVAPGAHDIYHVDPTKTFYLLLSGVTEYYSYGYVAGMRVAEINTVSIAQVLYTHVDFLLPSAGITSRGLPSAQVPTTCQKILELSKRFLKSRNHT